MAFELLLGTGRDDQISNLRRKETSQPTHSLYFANLVGDALFELLVEFRQFPRLRLKLLRLVSKVIEQTRIFNGDDSLRCEVLQQRNVFTSERAYLLSEDGANTSNLFLMAHWHAQHAAITALFYG